MAFSLRRKGEPGAREAVVALLRQLPRFVRLLYRLLRDPRVAGVDKALVLGVVGYVLTPVDLLPDFLGFFGLVDDLYLLGLAVDRLFARAGASLLREHWDGDPRALSALVDGVEQIGSFVPAPIRAVLRGRVER